MALYCHFSPWLSLKVLPDTTFACNFFVIACMLEVKDPLERMVIDPRWNEYMRPLFNWQNGHHAHMLVLVMKATIRDDGFWQQYENLEHMSNWSIKKCKSLMDAHL